MNSLFGFDANECGTCGKDCDINGRCISVCSTCYLARPAHEQNAGILALIAKHLPPVSSGAHTQEEEPAAYHQGYADATRDFDRVSEESIRAMLAALEARTLDRDISHMHDDGRHWRRGRRDAYRAYVAQEDAAAQEEHICPYCGGPCAQATNGEWVCIGILDSDGETYCPGFTDPDDDLNDAGLYPLISDHVPGESTRAAMLDDLRRDGQRWAAGLRNADDLLHARVLVKDLDGELLTERRAYCEGIAYGLEHGNKGLRPRMEALEQEEELNQFGPEMSGAY